MGIVCSAQVQDLFNDEVEKGEAVLDEKEGFRAGEAHACAEAAVQLDDDGLGEQRGRGCGFAGYFFEARQMPDRLDVFLADVPGAAGGKSFEVVASGSDRQGGLFVRPHLLFEGKEGLVLTGGFVLHGFVRDSVLSSVPDF